MHIDTRPPPCRGSHWRMEISSLSAVDCSMQCRLRGTPVRHQIFRDGMAVRQRRQDGVQLKNAIEFIHLDHDTAGRSCSAVHSDRGNCSHRTPNTFGRSPECRPSCPARGLIVRRQPLIDQLWGLRAFAAAPIGSRWFRSPWSRPLRSPKRRAELRTHEFQRGHGFVVSLNGLAGRRRPTSFQCPASVEMRS